MQKLQFQINIPVSIIRERNKFIAYTPALDLSTSGKNYLEVKKRFAEIVEIFFEEIIKRNTLEEALKDLGWTKKQTNWIPPIIISQDIQTIQVATR